MNDTSEVKASLTVALLRRELGLTLAEMGARVGLSKSQMHDVEKNSRASVAVALEIERLSEGRIDAAALNDDVRASRHGLPCRVDVDCPSTGSDTHSSSEGTVHA